MCWSDLVMKWQALAARQARVQTGAENRQPLSIAEHLDLLAMAEVIAQRLRNQGTVHAAILAGASWADLADAAGSDAGQMRADFARWVAAQRHCTRTMARAGVAPELKSTVQVLGPQVR